MFGLGKHDMLLLYVWVFGATEVYCNEGIKTISGIGHSLFYVNSGKNCEKSRHRNVELFTIMLPEADEMSLEVSSY